MMKYVMLLSVATLTAAIFALADVVGVDNTAHAQAGVPSNVIATNGSNPGEAVVSWDPVAGASEHRVGWLAVPDYQANIANDRWRERFAYSDVNANSSYTVTRLTPGTNYYFIVGRKQGNDIAWSQWATLTLTGGSLPCPAGPAVAPSTTSTLRVANGSNPGEIVASWDATTATTDYRVGWLAVPDYQANIANDRWRERFAYSDINPASSFTITRLTPGIAYYFILGTKQGETITWSQWATLALNPDTVACPGVGTTPDAPTTAPTQTFPSEPVNGDYDHDDDGLIEVRTLAQLDAVRLDLLGTSLVRIEDLPEYLTAFTNSADDMGCPADGCKGYELAAHLDFDTNGNGEADEGDDYWNDGAGWAPLTRRLYSHNSYLWWGGTFDGNHYTIANLYINLQGPEHPTGLFADNVGTIRNVNLVGVDITVQGEPLYGERTGVGSLAGYTDATIAGCTASGRVSGINDVGGLVGSNDQDISDSQANVTVSGNGNVGGLAGKMADNATITDSSALGAVSGRHYVGGLVGNNSSSQPQPITNSNASGNVSGDNYVGGLVGGSRQLGYSNAEPVINNGSATGNVTGRYAVGGLIGNNHGRIHDSTASGNVAAGEHAVGGLVGYNTGPITNSRATGSVSGQDRVGGLVGANIGNVAPAGVITNSTATGTVVGNDRVGGLIGDNRYGNIHSGMAQGQVTGRFYIGGLVGHHTGERRDPRGVRGLIEDSTASGNVIGVRWRGALVGVDDRGTIVNSTGSGTVSSPQ